MNYRIYYDCQSHIGRCRNINQDNFICDGKIMDENQNKSHFPLSGYFSQRQVSLVGIFDGMGGEECGEIASLLAAKCASKVVLDNKPIEGLLQFCQDANEEICRYETNHNILSMGTTAALLAFSKTEIALCNIGDSRIYRFADGKMEQISKDHVAVAAYGIKPPLSQNLGIPPSKMVIEPYVARGRYHDGDMYLLCSDGLTDMVTEKDIFEIIRETPYDKAVDKLLHTALENGGKDNITMILCRIERTQNSIFKKILKRQ